MKKLFLLVVACFIVVSSFSQGNDDSVKLRQEIPPVLIYPQERTTSLMTQSIDRISPYEIEKKETSSILPVLKSNVPGLYINSQGVAGYGVASGASGNITMRGFSGSAGRILILIDGHPQYAPIYGHPMADTYTSDNIEKVEVIHGAASFLYGSNAMGGAINFITKNVEDEGNTFKARTKIGSYGTTNIMVSDGYKRKRTMVFTSGNYEHSNGYRDNSEFNSLSGFAKVGYALNKHWNLTANANISHFDIEMPGSVSAPLNDCEANITRGIYSVSLDNVYFKYEDNGFLAHLKRKTFGTTDIYYNWGRHQINEGFKEGEKPQEYFFHSTDYMGGVNMKQSFFISKTATELIGGFNLKLYGGNAYRNPVTEIYADHLSFSETAGYILANQRLFITDLKENRLKMNLESGLRAENHSLYGTILIPLAGITLNSISKAGTVRFKNVKLLYSKGFRTPNMRELYMYAAANANLLPEHCHNFESSFEYYKIFKLFDNDVFSAKLNLYHTIGDNIVQTVMVDGKPKNQNVGEFKNTGVEFSMSRSIKVLTINGNYSYVYMEKPIVGSPRQKIGIDAEYHTQLFDVTKCTFSVGAQYIDKLYLAVGTEEKTKSFALLNAKISGTPYWKLLSVFVQGDFALCKGDYETMLGYPLPKFTCSAGLSINLYSPAGVKY